MKPKWLLGLSVVYDNNFELCETYFSILHRETMNIALSLKTSTSADQARGLPLCERERREKGHQSQISAVEAALQ